MKSALERIRTHCDVIGSTLDASVRNQMVAEIRTAAEALIDPFEVDELSTRISGYLDDRIAESSRKARETADPMEFARQMIIEQALSGVKSHCDSLLQPYINSVGPDLMDEDELERLAPKNGFSQHFEVFYSGRNSSTQSRKIAEGVIFTNGTVAVSWVVFNPRERLYSSIAEFRLEMDGNYSIMYPSRNGQVVAGLTSPLANVAYHEKRASKKDTVATPTPAGPTPNIIAKQHGVVLQSA